jgi:phage anti-repressor protein
MSTLTTIRDDNRLLVSANELFAAMGRKRTGTLNDDFRDWLADRIKSLDMEEGYDFFIFLNAESVREMLRFESAPVEVRRFFNNLEQYAEALSY